MKRPPRIVPILFLVALAPGTAARAVEVPITNPGFDADALASPGDDQPTITGWDTTAGGGDGIFRPTVSDYPGGIPSGQNVAYVNLPGNRVHQVLTTPLEPLTTYVLEVEIGWNNNDPFAGYIVQLRAGGVLLAEDDSSRTPAQGTFLTSTVRYTSGADHPQLGQPLEVRLLSPGIQANFDDVRLSAVAATVCAENLLVPFYLVDKDDPGGTQTLLAVRNLTGDPVTADLEYLTLNGTSQRKDSITLGPTETRTVSLRDVGGLAVDPDGFARGFVRILTGGSPDGTPVLAGDFFQVDVAENFATGDRLVRQADVCTDASIRFLDFGGGTRLTIWLTNPRGTGAAKPFSFTVQAYDESGAPVGGTTSVKTTLHAIELQASVFTNLTFGTLKFDFTNSLGGTVYAEYNADERFSVGVVSQCDDLSTCEEDCCPPGAPKAVSGAHYPDLDCEAAVADALRRLDIFFWRDACQQTHGGPLPDAVLGARLLECEEVAPPGTGSVVTVEVCCPVP